MCTCGDFFSSFFFYYLKTYIKIYMSPIEELSCWDVCMMMVSSSPSHTRSEQEEMHQGGRYSLFFSLFLSFFSNGRSLILSLSPVISIFFSSVLFLVSFRTADCRPSEEGTNHYTYISLPGRPFVLYSFWSMQAKTAAEVFNDWLQFDSFI